jgi:DNA-binding transcriptional LysR family regulator
MMMNMHDTNLAGLDLNLLVALDAMLLERNVTRAADRVGLSQPAMSHALSRLRGWFDDPLLVRSAAGMVPTTRARDLEGPLRRALEQMRDVVRSPTAFDPSTAERTFVLVTTDYGETLVLPDLLARLRNQAPGVNLLASPELADWAARLEDGSCDVFVGPLGPRTPAGIRSVQLFRERFVCLLRKDHPIGRRKLTLERFTSLQHVLVAPRGKAGSAVDDALAAKGLRRRVAAMVPHFLVAPLIVAQTDLVLTLPERTARKFAELLSLRLVAPPVELTGFAVHQAWHERVHRDPFHRWMREQVSAVVAGRG